MAVPSVNTIKLSDVCLEIYGNSSTVGKSLIDCHTDAVGTFVLANDTLGATKTLMDFRGYDHIGNSKLALNTLNNISNMTGYSDVWDEVEFNLVSNWTGNVYFLPDASPITPQFNATKQNHRIECRWASATHELLGGVTGTLTSSVLEWVSGPTVNFSGTTITGEYVGGTYYIKIDNIDDSFMTFPLIEAVYNVVPKDSGGNQLTPTLMATWSPETIADYPFETPIDCAEQWTEGYDLVTMYVSNGKISRNSNGIPLLNGEYDVGANGFWYCVTADEVWEIDSLGNYSVA